MKAKVKATREIVEVEKSATYNATWVDKTKGYNESELDFNLESEKAVIEGWVCRDSKFDEVLYEPHLLLYNRKPERCLGIWSECYDYILIPTEMFPSITWESEPQKVRIEITLIDEKGE